MPSIPRRAFGGLAQLGLPYVRQRIVSFIRILVETSGAEGVVVGLSGGVDSALVATLCVQALGKQRVFGLLMPEGKAKSVSAAEDYAKHLGIKYEKIEVSKIVSEFEKACGHKTRNKIALGNLRPRIRMVLLYYHANQMNCLVAGTGNKSELLTGYFSKYGDGGADFLPIGDLYKTEVRQLAEYVGVPKKIVDAVPSAGLWPGQTDEKELGVKYALLDKIIYRIYDEKKSVKQTAKELKIGEKIVEKVAARMRSAKHKLEMPAVCRVHAPFF